MMKKLNFKDMEKSADLIIIRARGSYRVREEIVKFFDGILSVINIVYPIRQVPERDMDEYYESLGYEY